MIDINHMSNKAFIKEQYKNADNLKLRKSLHEKYSVNKMGFQKWMFEQYPFWEKMKILELGSGRGELWKLYLKNEGLQRYEMDITLSDFSEGMVEELRRNYEGGGISVEKIDILDIPFKEETFDLVIANSMLYHVKDINRALSEVRRVLKRDGWFYCATFGLNGMAQYLYHALDELGIPHAHEANVSFTLQNGMQLLKKHFGKVERYDYEDSLEIDRVEDYVDYIYSMASLKGLDPEKYEVLCNYFEDRKVNGYLHVPKEYGMFAAGGE